jgi:Ser/Thr protein kinase RdoA (MazF antagonist)
MIGLEGAPYADLDPDALLGAVDGALAGGALDMRCSGQILALNSYENRVYSLGMEAAPAPAGTAPVPSEGPTGPGVSPPPLIAKFYRPGRWRDSQILEEHAFLAELAAEEVPVVAPCTPGGHSLHPVAGSAHRLALFPRQGGRTPELDDAGVRLRIGRFLGRLHAIGARQAFTQRMALTPATWGREPAAFLADGDWIPPHLTRSYASLAAQVLDRVEAAFAQAGASMQRIHGDCHPGNLLWFEGGDVPGPVFVDFDDCVSGPCVQDLWMLLSGPREDQETQLRDILQGYEAFRPFDRRELALIEPLRSLRLIHYSAWIARRWSDPAFPAAFPAFAEPHYWEVRLQELREQLSALDEEPLRP